MFFINTHTKNLKDIYYFKNYTLSQEIWRIFIILKTIYSHKNLKDIYCFENYKLGQTALSVFSKHKYLQIFQPWVCFKK